MKIPFDQTVSAAFRFAFSNLLSIAGIVWLPYLLLAAVVAGTVHMVGPQLLAVVAGGQNDDPARAMMIARTVMTFYAFVLPALLLVAAMVTVGLMRKALGLHPGPVFVFFSLGAQVWRLVGAYVLVALLFYGMVLLLSLVVGGGLYLVNRYAQDLVWLAAVPLVAAAVCWCVYAAVRLTFFLPAVVVAENHIGLRRAWHLGYGNFWRIVGVVLIVVLPVSFAASIIVGALVQIGMPGAAMMDPSDPTAGAKFIAQYLAAIANVWPYYLIVQILQFMLISGLHVGAIANAYRFVTGAVDGAPQKAAA